MAKFFVDSSIFQGVLEFTTPGGKEVRAVKRSSGIADVYVKAGDAYVMQATVRSKFTPEAVWNAYCA